MPLTPTCIGLCIALALLAAAGAVTLAMLELALRAEQRRADAMRRYLEACDAARAAGQPLPDRPADA